MKTLTFENKFMSLIKKKRILQWENYALNKKNDLNKANKEIYKFIKNTDINNLFKGRKKEIFNRVYIKYIIENDPEVAQLRNKLDNKDNYRLNSESKMNDKLKIAKRMREDVMQLIQLRNEKAKKLGYSSYPDLIFYTEELDKQTVIKIVKDYLNNNIKKANKLIKKYNLTWENWFKELRSIGDLESTNPDYYIDCLLNKTGLESVRDNLKFKYKEDGISGIAFGISPPEDIRILLKPVVSPMTCKVLFHECGHGINYTSNKEEGIYTLYTTSFDEIIATLFETIGLNICLSQKESKIALEIKLLEAVRCSISFLFEMELWENPNKAEELFREYQLKLAMETSQKHLWAIDSFRYIDPVYIHNYVLGELYSKKIINTLENLHDNNYKKWGKSIKKYFLNKGRKRSFKKKYFDFINESNSTSNSKLKTTNYEA